jgi:hypothetical protein
MTERSETTERAILKRVPDRLLDGLPLQDRDAIRNAVGKPVVVVPEDAKAYPSEHQEVEFQANGIIHTIWVDAADLEFITNDD